MQMNQALKDVISYLVSDPWTTSGLFPHLRNTSGVYHLILGPYSWLDDILTLVALSETANKPQKLHRLK